MIFSNNNGSSYAKCCAIYGNSTSSGSSFLFGSTLGLRFSNALNSASTSSSGGEIFIEGVGSSARRPVVHGQFIGGQGCGAIGYNTFGSANITGVNAIRLYLCGSPGGTFYGTFSLYGVL
jgi:hypothetical protein